MRLPWYLRRPNSRLQSQYRLPFLEQVFEFSEIHLSSIAPLSPDPSQAQDNTVVGNSNLSDVNEGLQWNLIPEYQISPLIDQR